MNKKTVYRQLCENNSLPLMMQANWLDAVCGKDNWDVCLQFDASGKPVAALPYFLQKRFFFLTEINMPPLTSRLGIWVPFLSEKFHTNWANYQKTVNELIKQLPVYQRLNYQFEINSPSILPFINKGFSHSNRFTFQLQNLENVDLLYQNFNENVRRNITKTTQNHHFSEGENIKVFYHFYKKCMDDRQMKMPFTLDILSNLWAYLAPQKLAYIFEVRDKNTTIKASALIVFDHQRAIYLLSCQEKSSSCLYFLIWNVLKFCISKGIKSFDFDGSMKPEIAHAFASMGAQPIPYNRISKMIFL